MVVDEIHHGWPVAHLISSKPDSATLKYFFQCLKARLGENSVNCVITDDDPALINAMNEGFSADLPHILCIWHVLKNFKENLRSKASKDLYDTMLSEVRVIMNEDNEGLFLKLIDGFQKKYENDKNASHFIDYFRKYYLNRPHKWALCYRQFPHGGVNTTGHLESFHNRLKKTWLKRKVNKRLDDIITILFE
ncbi:Protein FAR1-RELATED SEQUENCE 2 [Frankliniella fusca]|uniref:Protein FAR1-RELATED SEQUENCE 2 n=1 Tax=Frankliniella fusca TaxID=407009 RepID=A0AAE1HK65_9NEOP|nr:Protein FAR1-RELATED SEQUENCE 2 [Frankliniella fusca]